MILSAICAIFAEEAEVEVPKKTKRGIYSGGYGYGGYGLGGYGGYGLGGYGDYYGHGYPLSYSYYPYKSHYGGYYPYGYHGYGGYGGYGYYGWWFTTNKEHVYTQGKLTFCTLL